MKGSLSGPHGDGVGDSAAVVEGLGVGDGDAVLADAVGEGVGLSAGLGSGPQPARSKRTKKPGAIRRRIMRAGRR
ncbi:MAG: hypothetical protein R2722_13795 [Tessaracoccus sp.]